MRRNLGTVAKPTDYFSFKIYKGMIQEAIFIHINLKYAKKNKFRENDAKTTRSRNLTLI